MKQERFSEGSDFWLKIAEQAVDRDAGLVALWDVIVDGLPAKERQAIARKVRDSGRKYNGRRISAPMIKRLKAKLAHRDDYIQAKAFEICTAVNEVSQ